MVSPISPSGAQSVPISVWRSLLSQATPHHFKSGATLFEQESIGHSLWFVRSGTVELSRTFFGERHRLVYVSKGGLFGEMGLFGETLRGNSARAVTDVRAYEVGGSVARSFLLQYPSLALTLFHMVGSRAHDVEESLIEQLVQRNLQLQMHQARLEPQMRRRVKDLERTNEHLSQLAWQDPLTGCSNRRALEKVLELATHGQEPFALALFDVDHFKHYNDTHGHPEGDRALQSLVRLLQRRLRANDVLARYGGEEFCLILREVTGKVAAVVCERLRNAITEFVFPFEEQQPLGDFTVSMGLAVFPADSRDPQRLVKVADERLYEAKRQGRNRLISGPHASL